MLETEGLAVSTEEAAEEKVALALPPVGRADTLTEDVAEGEALLEGEGEGEDRGE